MSTPRCGYEVGVEHWQSLLCGRPAVVRVDMREHGSIHLCRRHLTQAAYRDMRERGYSWQPV